MHVVARARYASTHDLIPPVGCVTFVSHGYMIHLQMFGPSTGAYPLYLTWRDLTRLGEVACGALDKFSTSLQPTGVFSVDDTGMQQLFKHSAGRVVPIPVPAGAVSMDDLHAMAPTQWCAEPQEFTVDSPCVTPSSLLSLHLLFCRPAFHLHCPCRMSILEIHIRSRLARLRKNDLGSEVD